MWLITYSQRGIVANTHTYKDENPAQWLYRMCRELPETKTLLLFAVEVPDEDAWKL